MFTEANCRNKASTSTFTTYLEHMGDRENKADSYMEMRKSCLRGSDTASSCVASYQTTRRQSGLNVHIFILKPTAKVTMFVAIIFSNSCELVNGT